MWNSRDVRRNEDVLKLRLVSLNNFPLLKFDHLIDWFLREQANDWLMTTCTRTSQMSYHVCFIYFSKGKNFNDKVNFNWLAWDTFEMNEKRNG